MDWLVGLGCLVYIVLAPYTKVEESFNIQACHDILYHRISLHEYDHFEYPGVVPRTFLGPFMLSILSAPFVFIVNSFGLSKLYVQYIVRITLGLLVFIAWKKLRREICATFGSSVSLWFTVITASQFHFIYYMSRPLPNVFALIFALLSFKYWLQQHHTKFLAASGVGVFIFRSELVLLLGPMLLYDLAKKKLDIIKFLRSAIPIGLGCLFATITVDSIMWQRLLWPEGDVFWFNTYQHQSSNWGVYPFLWYWYSCLPRALGFSLILVPVGSVIDLRVQSMLLPGLVFVALYSFLPHKELRFIIYVFPLFNLASARACHFFWTGRHKSKLRQLLALACLLHVVANFCFSVLLVTISCQNYPGGSVITKLHEIVANTEPVNVHIDNFAAQTGITRFSQLNDLWSYNKTEQLKAGGEELNEFTHLIVEAKSKYAYNLKHYVNTHKILDYVEAFSHLHFNYQSFPPIKIRRKPAIYILEKLKDDILDESDVTDSDYTQDIEEQLIEDFDPLLNIEIEEDVGSPVNNKNNLDDNVNEESDSPIDDNKILEEKFNGDRPTKIEIVEEDIEESPKTEKTKKKKNSKTSKKPKKKSTGETIENDARREERETFENDELASSDEIGDIREVT